MNQKIKLVSNWIKTGRKEASKNKLFWKYKEDARSLHGVRSGDAFLLSDCNKLSTKPEKWTVCYSSFLLEK